MDNKSLVYKRLRYRPVDEIEEHYHAKNELLAHYGEWVSARTMYEDIFPDLDMVMPVVFIDEDEDKHVVKMTIDEAIETCQGRNDVLLGATSYFNEFVSKATSKNIYAFIIDMDNVYSNILSLSLQNNWKDFSDKDVPIPTYIVNSGVGLHLYFVLDKPLPCYKSQLANIDQLYRALAIKETTGRTYVEKSVQWFGQDFRMAGGIGKTGWETTVFRVGEKWDVDELGKAVGLENVHFVHEGEPRPEVKQRLKKDKKKSAPRKGYYLNRAVYDSSIERVRKETPEGHRYTGMMALSVLAWKCNVPKEELERDLVSLLPSFNEGAVTKIKPKEIRSAMKMYNPKAIDTPKIRTEEWLNWKFKGSRRNGRTQEVHLKIARSTRDILHPEGWYSKEGRPSKADIVQKWQEAHPDGRKIDCERATGLSRHTVLKWWN